MKLSNKAIILLIIAFISHPYKSWPESSADHANIAAENLIEHDELIIEDSMSESDNKDSTESSQDFIWGRIVQNPTSPATITETSTQLDITQGQFEKALKNKNYDEANKLSRELDTLRSVYKNLAESSKEKFYAITSTRFNYAETIPLTKYRIDNVIKHLEKQANSTSTGDAERKQITNEINTLKDIKKQFKINPETLKTAQEYYAQGTGNKNINKLKDKEESIKIMTSYKKLGESTKKLNQAIKRENDAEVKNAVLANDRASEKFLSSVKEFDKYIDASERNKRKDDFRLKQKQNAITKAQLNNIKITEQNKILDQAERQQRIQNYREQQKEIQKNIEITKQNKLLDQAERQQRIKNHKEQQRERKKEKKDINIKAPNTNKTLAKKYRRPIQLTLKKIHLESLIAKSNMALSE